TSVLAIAVRDGGKILVTGSDFQASGFFFAAARYNPDGSLDSTFGNGGLLSAPFFPGTDPLGADAHLTATAMGPACKFLAAGNAHFGLALARYNGDGSPDTSFGAGGTVVTHITDPRTREGDGILGIAFQADRQIVVTGAASGDNDLVLARYNTEPDFSLS